MGRRDSTIRPKAARAKLGEDGRPLTDGIGRTVQIIEQPGTIRAKSGEIQGTDAVGKGADAASVQQVRALGAQFARLQEQFNQLPVLDPESIATILATQAKLGRSLTTALSEIEAQTERVNAISSGTNDTGLASALQTLKEASETQGQTLGKIIPQVNLISRLLQCSTIEKEGGGHNDRSETLATMDELGTTMTETLMRLENGLTKLGDVLQIQDGSTDDTVVCARLDDVEAAVSGNVDLRTAMSERLDEVEQAASGNADAVKALAKKVKKK